MKPSKLFFILLGLASVLCADCSKLPPEVQQFAGELTPLNRETFCDTFTDGQRASAMQMATAEGEEGIVTTPDMAVQKVAESNGTQPKTTSKNCPMR